MMSGQTICVVDAFSTGAELAGEFAKYGYETIHVQSSPDVDSDLLRTFRGNDFRFHVVFDNSRWTELLDAVRQWRPEFVIAGTETGVVLADRLAHALSLPGNDPGTSELRRNKFLMNEALKKAAIPSVEQSCCSSAEEAVNWAEERGIWPVVAKPLDSAGTDDVYFCGSKRELREACARILFHTNRMGSYNDKLLVQECLEGQQYFINAVSIGGSHVFTEIWQDTKKRVDGASMICDKEELLPYEGETQQRIRAYMTEVLDGLGVREGASHSELMMTERGPVLIESAARMQGTILHDALIAAIGDSHVTTTVERYAAPERFRERIGHGYTMNQYLYCITLASNESGVVVENRIEQLLANLPSYYAVFHTPAVGEQIQRTVDLFSNPGIIYLMHESKAQIEEDYRRIREMEQAGELLRLKRIV